MNKKILGMIAAAVVVAGGLGFWGGTIYKSSGAPAGSLRAGTFQGQVGGMRRNAVGTTGGFVSGAVISKDTGSLTIDMRDSRQPSQGGSKIILLSSSTAVAKSAAGTIGDVGIGNEVTVIGKMNPDGSITAETIQIRGMANARQ